MAVSALDSKSIYPNEDMVAMVLAENYKLWDDFKKHLAATYPKVTEEWKFYGKEAGWTLAVFSDKRRLTNLIPQERTFQVTFVYSVKARDVVLASADIPESIKNLMPDEKQCVCGHGFRMNIKTTEDLEIALKLIDIKDKN